MQFLDYLNALPQDEYIAVHKTRYVQTMSWLEPLVAAGGPLLELGPRSVITNYLADHRGIVVHNVESDLRYPFDIPSGTYQVVLNMEIIEHLKDRDEDNRDYWGRTMTTWSGVRSCLTECARVLTGGGSMLCTTPNPSSTVALDRIFAHQPAMVYAPHVRELTLPEIKERVAEAGLEIVRLETLWSWHMPADAQRVLRALEAIRVSTADRGDNTFFVARRRTP